MDAHILSALRGAKAGSVSGGELAQRLGVSRASISARIQDLRALGYDIESSPHGGYRLRSAPDLLHSDDLFSRLGKTKVIGRDIRVFNETTSTNDVAERLAADGVKEGVVVIAEAQTKGRGRLGRKWISPARKGLWFSVLLRPRLRPGEATRLTIAASTALVRAISAVAGLSPEVKWPNDILVSGRKVAGVLTELSADVEQVKHVILGIGVDVNLTAHELPADLRKTATSLRIETGQPVMRAELLAAILRELDHDYTRLASGKFERIADEWEAACTTIGKNVKIRVGERVIQGRAECLASDGALLVRTQHGLLDRVLGGDVTLEK